METLDPASNDARSVVAAVQGSAGPDPTRAAPLPGDQPDLRAAGIVHRLHDLRRWSLPTSRDDRDHPPADRGAGHAGDRSDADHPHRRRRSGRRHGDAAHPSRRRQGRRRSGRARLPRPAHRSGRRHRARRLPWRARGEDRPATVHRHARHVLHLQLARPRLQQGADDLEGGARRRRLAPAVDRQGHLARIDADHDRRARRAGAVHRLRLHPRRTRRGVGTCTRPATTARRPASPASTSPASSSASTSSPVSCTRSAGGSNSGARCRRAATPRPTSTWRRSPPS